MQGNLNNKNGQLYTFDMGNRLRDAPGEETDYRYDAYGRRAVSYWTGTGSGHMRSYYATDGQLLFQQDQRNAKRIDYINFGGSLVATRERPATAETVTVKYHHTDALGSPIAVTDASKAIIETKEYEPFGQQVNLVGPPKDGPGFTGHVQDAATGLTYMQQRYYDPMIGRFLSVDPVTANPGTGANFNRYWYANNNPYKFTDPDGRAPCRNDNPNCDPTRDPIAQRRCAETCLGGNNKTRKEKTVKSYADLPKLPDREKSADGERSAGESWERVTRYTGTQEIKWNEPGEGTTVPIIDVAMRLVKSNALSKVVIPEIIVAKRYGHLALEYQVGFKHVFNTFSNNSYSTNADVYGGHGTVWTEEKFFRLDTSPQGQVNEYVLDVGY